MHSVLLVTNDSSLRPNDIILSQAINDAHRDGYHIVDLGEFKKAMTIWLISRGNGVRSRCVSTHILGLSSQAENSSDGTEGLLA